MKNYRKIIFYTLLGGMIVYIAIFSGINIRVLFETLSIYTFTFYSIIIFVCYLQSAYFLRLNLKIVGLREHNFALLKYTQATNLLNYLPMKAGVLLLGGYLKKKHGLSVINYVYFNIVNYAFITIASVSVLLFVILFGDKDITREIGINIADTSVFDVLMITSILIFIFILTLYSISKKYNTFFTEKYLKLLYKKLRQFFCDIELVTEYTINTYIQIFLFGLRMYFAFYLAGSQITYFNAITIGVLANLSFLVSLTPGAIGIKEGTIAIASFILTGNAEAGLFASIIDRSINLVWIMFTGFISIYLIEKEKI